MREPFTMNIQLFADQTTDPETNLITKSQMSKVREVDFVLRFTHNSLAKLIEALDGQYSHIRLGIETMGKLNQLGTLDEVLEQCRVHPQFVPVVDFGHLNCREEGRAFPDADSYRRVFDRIAESCGDEVARTLHCHFSKIEYTGAGEKKHLTFEDNVYGPQFEPLAEAIVKDDLAPRIICESDGTMAEDALAMQNCYRAYFL